jgi:hypothetical protein
LVSNLPLLSVMVDDSMFIHVIIVLFVFRYLRFIRI